MSQKFFRLNRQMRLESGQVLLEPTLSYRIYGDAEDDERPVIWVCHALTANDDPFEWWDGLFGDNSLFNSEEFTIICANMIGSCYGSTGPLSINPINGQPYHHEFPVLTVRDMAKAFAQLALSLGIDKVDLLIGASLGGQVALQWAVDDPNLFGSAVFLATNVSHSPWGIAFNESQRMAIENDPTWQKHTADSGLAGMKVARSMALLSYRNYNCYKEDQSRDASDTPFEFSAQSYQRYQGEKLARRFNAISYHRLSKVMDSHDISKGHGSVNNALSRLRMPVLSISMEGDILFPLNEQEEIADGIKDAIHMEIPTKKGHDGFLIETEKLSLILEEFVQKNIGEKITL